MQKSIFKAFTPNVSPKRTIQKTKKLKQNNNNINNNNKVNKIYISNLEHNEPY